MIAASHMCSNFRALAAYLEQPKSGREDMRRVAWTQRRNLFCSDTTQEAAREMEIVARGNERVQKPVYHLSVSWAPEDTPRPDQMCEVADGLLEDLALSEHQALFVAHADEAYKHMHIMANRVHPETRKTLNLGLHYRQIQCNLRHAERTYGFRETPGHLFQLEGQEPPDRSMSLSKGAHKASVRDGRLPFQFLVARAARKDFEDAKSWSDLQRRLQHHGLRLEPRRSGLVVTDGREYAKSSSVAQGVSRARLEERFGESYADAMERQRGGLSAQAKALARQFEAYKATPPGLSAAAQEAQLARAFRRLEKAGDLRHALGRTVHSALTRLAARGRVAEALFR